MPIVLAPNSIDYSKRASEIQAEARDLYREMGGKGKEISVIFKDEAFAQANDKQIELSPIFLLNKGEVQYLNDTLTLKQRGKTVKDFWSSPPNSLVKHLWTRVDELDRIKRFGLAHEIAHIVLDHASKQRSFLPGQLFGATCTSMYLVHALAISNLIAIVAIYYCVFKLFSLMVAYHFQHHEHEADLAALKITQDFKAAKVFFKILPRLKKQHWNHMPLYKKILVLLLNPDGVLHISHPHPHERLKYLRRHWTPA